MTLAYNPLPTVKLDRTWVVGRPLIGCRYDATGRFFFTSAEDNTVRRLDLLTGEVIALNAHSSWVRGMAIISNSSDGLAETVTFERKQAALRAAAGPVVSGVAAPKPHPITAVTGDYHGNVIWWDAHQPMPKPVRTVPAHDGWVRSIAASADGKLVASCGNDRLVKLWSVETGERIRTLKGHESHVYNVAFHPDGRHVASCDLKGFVKIWDLTNGICEKQLDASALYKYDAGFMADIGGARGMAYDPKSGRLACCGITNVSNAFAGVGNPIVVAFDGKDGKPKLLKPVETFQGTAWGVAFHPRGFVVAAGGGNGGRLWMWFRGESQFIRSVIVPASARDMALHPAGDRVAVAGANGTAYFYSLHHSLPQN